MEAGKPAGPGKFATPDPVFTYETALILVGTVISDVIVLLGLDLSDAKKAAITGISNAAVAVGFIIYAAVVRHGRAVGNASK